MRFVKNENKNFKHKHKGWVGFDVYKREGKTKWSSQYHGCGGDKTHTLVLINAYLKACLKTNLIQGLFGFIWFWACVLVSAQPWVGVGCWAWPNIYLA